MAAKSGIPPTHLPAVYEPWHVAAIQALAAGTATEDQQKTALEWIVNAAASTYDQPYRPGVDGDRETAFGCGRQFVGQQIVKLLKLNAAAISQAKRKTND